MFVLTSKHEHSLRMGSHLQKSPPALEAPTRGNAKIILILVVTLILVVVIQIHTTTT